MDGKMKMAEKERDQMKNIKRNALVESGETLAYSCFLFRSLHNTGTLKRT
jgi:hypothetical protein